MPPSKRPVAIWCTGLVSAFFVLLGLGAYLDPVGASARFGLPMRTAAETTFVQVYGSRNGLLGAVALVFVVLDLRRALAILLSMAAVLPWLDAAVVVSRIGWEAPVLARHATYFVILAALGVGLWRADGRDATTRAP